MDTPSTTTLLKALMARQSQAFVRGWKAMGSPLHTDSTDYPEPWLDMACRYACVGAVRALLRAGACVQGGAAPRLIFTPFDALMLGARAQEGKWTLNRLHHEQGCLRALVEAGLTPYDASHKSLRWEHWLSRATVPLLRWCVATYGNQWLMLPSESVTLDTWSHGIKPEWEEESWVPYAQVWKKAIAHDSPYLWEAVHQPWTPLNPRERLHQRTWAAMQAVESLSPELLRYWKCRPRAVPVRSMEIMFATCERWERTRQGWPEESQKIFYNVYTRREEERKQAHQIERSQAMAPWVITDQLEPEAQALAVLGLHRCGAASWTPPWWAALAKKDWDVAQWSRNALHTLHVRGDVNLLAKVETMGLRADIVLDEVPLSQWWFSSASQAQGAEQEAWLDWLSARTDVPDDAYLPLLRSPVAVQAITLWRERRPAASVSVRDADGIPALFLAAYRDPALAQKMVEWGASWDERTAQEAGFGAAWLYQCTHLNPSPALAQNAHKFDAVPHDVWTQPDAQGRWPMEAWWSQWYDLSVGLPATPPAAHAREKADALWWRATQAVAAGARWRPDFVRPEWLAAAQARWQTTRMGHVWDRALLDVELNPAQAPSLARVRL